MPRNPRKKNGRKKGCRRFIGRRFKNHDYANKQQEYVEGLEEEVEIHYQSECENSVDEEVCEPYSTGFIGFDLVSCRRPIRCISLFDGISVGYHCLRDLKLVVGAYFASEIDEKALKLQKYNLGEAVQPLGCIKSITSDVLKSLGNIDLILAAPPCQDFSSANPNRRNFLGENGQLFFEFIRILRELTATSKETNIPLYFLCENVRSMELSVRNEISKAIGVQPTVHNAKKYGYMNRPRLFWTNLPEESESSLGGPQNSGNLQDVLAFGRVANVPVLPCLTTTYHSQVSGKGACKKMPVLENGKEESLLIVERERAFGLPSSFTDGADLGVVDRRILLGRAWCANTIKDILRPLRSIYQTYD